MSFLSFHPRRGLPALLLAFSLLAPWAVAAPSPLDDATKALDDGVAEVAIVKLQQQLATNPPDAELRRQLKTKLAEAFLAAGRKEDALRQIGDPEVKAPLLEARIQAAAGNWGTRLDAGCQACR